MKRALFLVLFLSTTLTAGADLKNPFIRPKTQELRQQAAFPIVRGIIESEGRRATLLDFAGKSFVCHPGDIIDECQILGIGSHSVTIRLGNCKRVIPLFASVKRT